MATTRKNWPNGRFFDKSIDRPHTKVITVCYYKNGQIFNRPGVARAALQSPLSFMGT